LGAAETGASQAESSGWATELQSYKSLPDYLWQTEAVYGWFNAAGALGVF
jgi:hypothetical protein